MRFLFNPAWGKEAVRTAALPPHPPIGASNPDAHRRERHEETYQLHDKRQQYWPMAAIMEPKKSQTDYGDCVHATLKLGTSFVGVEPDAAHCLSLGGSGRTDVGRVSLFFLVRAAVDARNWAKKFV